MAKKLSIQPQALAGTGTVANLLNGAFASLSGPIGFVPTQPRIVVKGAVAVNTDSTPHGLVLYKGASSGNAAGTQVYEGSIGQGATVSLPIPDDLVLEAADFLTGVSDTSVVITITAEIEF